MIQLAAEAITSSSGSTITYTCFPKISSRILRSVVPFRWVKKLANVIFADRNEGWMLQVHSICKSMCEMLGRARSLISLLSEETVFWALYFNNGVKEKGKIYHHFDVCNMSTEISPNVVGQKHQPSTFPLVFFWPKELSLTESSPVWPLLI